MVGLKVFDSVGDCVVDQRVIQRRVVGVLSFLLVV